MQKTRIEVWANIAAHTDSCKAAQLTVENWCNKMTNMANSNKEAEIDSINVILVEFRIQTKTSLADSIQETRHRWTIDDFTKCNNIKLITSLIMNIRAESATHIEESLLICCCQVAEIDCLDISNVDNVSEDIVLLWQEIIRRGNQLVKEDIDIDYVQDNSNSASHHNFFTRVLEPIIDEIEMLEQHLTEIEYSRLGKDPQIVILYDIIHNQFSLNHLQRVIVKEALNHAILNKKINAVIKIINFCFMSEKMEELEKAGS